MTGPQQLAPTSRPDADDVEALACPKCDAQPGSPCRSRGVAVASAYHTRRFTLVPRLKKALRVPTRPAAGPGPAEAARHPRHRAGGQSVTGIPGPRGLSWSARARG
ncbi:zinc finger domain-containing protein [Streptomyces rubiginosohelvolus]